MSENIKEPSQPTKKLKPMITRASYIDYDFSSIVDTRGGFLYEKTSEFDPKRKNTGPTVIQDIPTITDAGEALRCKECNSLEIDPGFLQIFRLKVCDNCKRDFPDKFSLLTKTEVKEKVSNSQIPYRLVFLIKKCIDELRDKELFLSWSKPNPRKSTWNNMLLYVREQVEEYAYKKWGGPEKLDEEFERRENLKRKKKATKFKEKLKDLRKRTRTEQWQKDRVNRFQTDSSGDKAHIHDFGTTQPHPDDSEKSIRICSICNFLMEVEVF